MTTEAEEAHIDPASLLDEEIDKKRLFDKYDRDRLALAYNQPDVYMREDVGRMKIVMFKDEVYEKIKQIRHTRPKHVE